MKSDPGQPMTLGNVAKAKLRLIAWCRGCERWAECDVTWLARLRGLTRVHAAMASMAPTSGPNIPNIVPAKGAELRNAARGSLAADSWQNRLFPA